MDRDIKKADECNMELNKFNPRDCEHATPYMVDNGVLDIYRCKRIIGNCYFEPNGGKPFKKSCDDEMR